MNDLYAKLKTFGKLKTNEPLSRHTTFKIGGPADFLVAVDETEKLVELLKYLDTEGVNHFVIGGGSNMLVNDEGYRGVVIKISDIRYQISGSTIKAAAGLSTVALAHATIKAGLTGFEWGVGVPGTIGGAVKGNAGAMGREMVQVVEKVEIYRNGEVIILDNQHCHFDYRSSVFKHSNDVVLRVWLKLEKLETENGKQERVGMEKALDHLKYRNKTQPQGNASTGCIFKNVSLEGNHGEQHRLRLVQHFDIKDSKVEKFLHIEKISAGWLVEQAGMKGAKIGNAQVSNKHGNFIINLGGAKSVDVRMLIEQVKQKVYDKYGVGLEEEIQII
jgi:UDP-N-acetylmuramate dehydrogenase